MKETYTTKLDTVLLRVRTPCCDRAIRLTALVDVPRETYGRTCSGCRERWTIERSLVRSSKAMRIDVITWSIDPQDR